MRRNRRGNEERRGGRGRRSSACGGPSGRPWRDLDGSGINPRIVGHRRARNPCEKT